MDDVPTVTPAESEDSVVVDRLDMIRGMRPEITPGRFVYRAVPAETLQSVLADCEALVREAEGLSAILPAGPSDRLVLRRITLNVQSSLQGLGLTAAVAGALAEAGIACNMVAGLRHDHAYVPEADAERALDILTRLSAGAT